MKKNALLLVFLFASFCVQCQNNAAGFEKVILSGNSDKAFEFVRNMFGVPAATEPFLYFKERGIKQLVSFYEHKEKKIEATSLIKFQQTKEFWKNYSEQFTAGKWNYKSLYKTDSLAWQAANYSIILIYAHEMGHYMSYNLTSDFDNDYTCEEVVANECLAAFANTFNGNKKMDMHKKLFLSLVKQTAALIPDSNKTKFSLPMDKWCSPNPMSSFFDYYQEDEIRFLRLYGFIQFKMMEQTLNNYKGGSLNNFLETTFLNSYNTYTGKEQFKPLRYKTISGKNYSNLSNCRVWLSNIKTRHGNYFYPRIHNNYRYHIGKNGEIFDSYIHRKSLFYPDTIEPNTYYRYILTNEEQKTDTAFPLQNLIYIDSLSSRHSPGKSLSVVIDVTSVFTEGDNFNYLIKKFHIISDVSSYDNDTTFTQYEFLHQFRADSGYYFKRFTMPDSLQHNNRMENQELLLAGVNTGIPVVITNELTKQEHAQIISIYPVNTDSARLEPPIWQGASDKIGYFNMLYPTLYIDDTAKTINLAFWNPATLKVYLIKIKKDGTESYELYNQTVQGKYGPSLRVNAMRFTAANKLQVLAETRQPGNNTKPIIQHLLIGW